MRRQNSFFRRGLLKVVLIVLMGLQLTSCGSNTDPLDIFDEPFPAMNAFATSFTALSQPFTTNTPYWQFAFASLGGGFYLAPAKGIVTEIGASGTPFGSGSVLTIVHSGRLATKLYGLQNVNVRQGDFVNSGQVIGSFFSGSVITFQVLLDGSPVCPFSFMSSQFRQLFSVANACL